MSSLAWPSGSVGSLSLLKILCLIKSIAVARFVTSTCRHWRMKSFESSEIASHSGEKNSNAPVLIFETSPSMLPSSAQKGGAAQSIM